MGGCRAAAAVPPSPALISLSCFSSTQPVSLRGRRGWECSRAACASARGARSLSRGHGGSGEYLARSHYISRYIRCCPEGVTTFAPHGGRTAPLAAGARLIAAPTPRRRHLARRGAALRRRQNGRELAARPRQQKQQRLNFSFSSRLVLSQAHTRATCARVAAFAPRRIRTGSQPARRRRAAAKCTTLTSLRCCCFGTS